LPDHAGWSELLISEADSCVTFWLQLLVSSSPSEVLNAAFGSGDQLCNPLLALLFTVFVYWDFHIWGLWFFSTLWSKLFLAPVTTEPNWG
jgi:hypothetical protein